MNRPCNAWEHGQVVPISVGANHELPLPHMEGPACHVRFSTLDHPSPFTGHDTRAPPTFRRDPLVRSAYSEGRACQVRRSTLDHPLPFRGD
jgi:hypothetical protein